MRIRMIPHLGILPWRVPMIDQWGLWSSWDRRRKIHTESSLLHNQKALSMPVLWTSSLRQLKPNVRGNCRNFAQWLRVNIGIDQWVDRTHLQWQNRYYSRIFGIRQVPNSNNRPCIDHIFVQLLLLYIDIDQFGGRIGYRKRPRYSYMLNIPEKKKKECLRYWWRQHCFVTITSSKNNELEEKGLTYYTYFHFVYAFSPLHHTYKVVPLEKSQKEMAMEGKRCISVP